MNRTQQKIILNYPKLIYMLCCFMLSPSFTQFLFQVEIHYTASAGGVLLDTSCRGEPIKFTMGSGNVMEARDRIVSTMRKAGRRRDGIKPRGW